jgi:tetratricopeptide (TPR) repeat protein
VMGDFFDPSDQGDGIKRCANLIHREILQLAMLVAVAVAAFLVTRVIATDNHDMTVRDAAEWYQRGQHQLAAGDADGAIDSFQRATAKNRIEKRYVLALARALAGAHQDEAARSALLALRESAPEDLEVNLQLARLAADRQDVTEAIRFYHTAVYGSWPADAAARQRVRAELVRFLLTHDQASRAVAELIALGTDLPDDAASHVEVGQLFLAAGDSRHALDQFQRALRAAPDSGAALAGAGQAAVRIGDFTLARKYLRKAPDGAGGVAENRELVDLVLSHDPLAAHIGSSARHQRLADSFSYAEQRLHSCIEQPSRGHEPTDELALRDEAEAFKTQLSSFAVHEEDTIETGVELIYRIERDLAQHCSPLAPLDRALILIGRRHGADQR